MFLLLETLHRKSSDQFAKNHFMQQPLALVREIAEGHSEPPDSRRISREELTASNGHRRSNWGCQYTVPSGIQKFPFNGFVLYGKYSRGDVCKILDCQNEVASTSYGHKIRYETVSYGVCRYRRKYRRHVAPQVSRRPVRSRPRGLIILVTTIKKELSMICRKKLQTVFGA